jgi:YggT family protein
VLEIVGRVIGSILILYLLLLSMRIILGWLTSRDGSRTIMGKPWELLCRVTDPYLGLFYRMRFLRRGIFDFTPVAAFLVLIVLFNVVESITEYQRITLGLVLSIIVWAAWSGARFLVLFFLVVGLLRTIPIIFRSVSDAMIWRVADLIIQPAIAFVMRLFRLGRRSGSTQYLILTIGLFFATWLLGEIVVWQVTSLLRLLPI